MNYKSFRQDLKVAIEQDLTVESVDGFEVEFVGTGDFMDEADLREKYTSRAGRADEIIKNTNKIYCKNAEVELYEDMMYKSKKTFAERNGHQQVR